MIIWDNVSVAKSTGGVRLVGPGAKMSERGRVEGKANTATAISEGKPEPNHKAIKQLLLLPVLKLNCLQTITSTQHILPLCLKKYILKTRNFLLQEQHGS